jgi:hypothetical protein
MEFFANNISHFRFNGDVLNFITSGSCVTRLGTALKGLRAVKSITIQPHTVLSTDDTHEIKQKKLRESKVSWSMAPRALLSTVVTYGPHLQVLRVKTTQPSVSVPILTLSLFALSPHRLSSLNRFEIELDVEVGPGI